MDVGERLVDLVVLNGEHGSKSEGGEAMEDEVGDGELAGDVHPPRLEVVGDDARRRRVLTVEVFEEWGLEKGHGEEEVGEEVWGVDEVDVLAGVRDGGGGGREREGSEADGEVGGGDECGEGVETGEVGWGDDDGDDGAVGGEKTSHVAGRDDVALG